MVLVGWAFLSILTLSSFNWSCLSLIAYVLKNSVKKRLLLLGFIDGSIEGIKLLLDDFIGVCAQIVEKYI